VSESVLELGSVSGLARAWACVRVCEKECERESVCERECVREIVGVRESTCDRERECV